MTTVIEKERRWLLKGTPCEMENNEDVTHLEVVQFYTPDGWRYRRTIDVRTDEEEFVKLKKIPIDRGVNHEIDLEHITEEEFDEAYEKGEEEGTIRIITKDRYIFEHEGKKIEMDDFDNANLTILEVEDVDLNDTVVFPDWLEQLILMEVTGMPKFSNYSLADNINDTEDYE